MLAARHLTVVRGAQVVLDAVDLVVDGTSRIGVLGRNGAGKSTLLRCLAGLEVADGRDGRALAARAERRLPGPGARPAGRGDHRRLPAPPHRPGRGRGGHGGPPCGPSATTRARQSWRPTTTPWPASWPSAATTTTPAPPACWPTSASTRACSRSPWPGCRAASGSRPAWPPSCSPASTCCCWTSRPTTSTSTAWPAWSGSWPPRSGRWSWSATTGPSCPPPPPASPSSTCTPAASAEYGGGYDAYVEERRRRREQAYADYDEARAERSRLEEAARQKREWAASRRGERRTDNDKALAGRRKERATAGATRAKAIERRLERLGDPQKPWEGWDLRLSLQAGRRSGEVVASLAGATVRAGPLPARPGRPGAALARPPGPDRAERRRQVDPARAADRRAAPGGGHRPARVGGGRRPPRPGPHPWPGHPAGHGPGADRAVGRAGPVPAGQVRPRAPST